MSEQVYSLDEIIRMVLPLLKKYHAERAILFGSYARQDADPASDIDLLVIGGERFDPTDVFCIADELFRQSGNPVDVYEQCEVDTETDFYKNILAEGVTIAQHLSV